jgi:hypothetical protein
MKPLSYFALTRELGCGSAALQCGKAVSVELAASRELRSRKPRDVNKREAN